MMKTTLVAWASPYELPLIVYVGRDGESTDRVHEMAQAVISALPADEDFKALIYNTLSIGPRIACETLIFSAGR